MPYLAELIKLYFLLNLKDRSTVITVLNELQIDTGKKLIFINPIVAFVALAITGTTLNRIFF